MEHDIPEELLSPYNPHDTEETTYDRWRASGYFHPETQIEHGTLPPDAPSFSMVLPPPNVTGVLHDGHALTITIEDIMIRYKRMRGYRALWIPGTDHAAIATQSKVEKQLDKEGVKKQDIGREKFLEKVQAFALESQSTIQNQIRRMGASVDWEREAFTLDEKRQRAVYTAFKRMFDDGLIYRGHRIVNWDPKGRTTVSDDEVEHEEGSATLYTFRYSPDFPIPVATTRLETKVGDTAVAVHPEDERYRQYIGQEFDVSFCGVDLHIKIVGDEAVDPAFGTGAVGVTPAHSQTDWEIAERHNLQMVQVIDERARMMVQDERLAEKKTGEAREVIADWLRDNNLLENEETVEHNISKAQRSGGVIEPLPKIQWFIDVNKEFTLPRSNLTGISGGETVTLKGLMRAAVESGDIRFIPERFTKNYFNWINNLRDWCISRQIWYGHRIPVWYRGEEISVDTQPPKGGGWEQDPDTLDTWFSSGLWTFSTLGWPDETDDLKIYHPTSMLETGHDILFFWIARMVLMSTYHLGEVPFKTVYLHGMVRDAKGEKMSKSKGNAIDPIEEIEKFGTDALRMALIVGNTPGTDLSLSENKIKAYKHFANKIWNATRFVISNVDTDNLKEKPSLTEADRTRLDEFQQFSKTVTKELDAYHLHIASEKLYDYFWHTFADGIIEERKEILNGTDETAKASAQWLLYHILHESIILLHPFMPFITETIWSLLPTTPTDDLLMVRSWPVE
ncbi:MAG: valine--tRNA ligase [Candidatus Paceibacterota bacterium]